MKKLALTFAIVLVMSIGAFAQNGGLFGMGPQRQSEGSYYTSSRENGLILPDSHGYGSDTGATPVPMGSGVAMLIGLGAAYAVAKKRKE